MTADTELDDRWILGLRDVIVESVDREEFRILIVLADGRTLTIEGAATLGTLDTTEPRTDVWDAQEGEEDTLAHLVGQRVLSAVVFKTGALRLVLSSGTCVRVPADDHYEAWQLSDVDGSMLISLPGGGVAKVPGPD
ncbi:DUF6188 family protein [Nocardioides sp. SYSU D00038]|uniref:DUF6188 family protein n=1 Tax=Nocardioides sp. SYSU D00038 TaxID=2812554 RepID=UPI0019686C97|nr:DUF6188 family protein [Nocardioides sp. SYSU D00038]